MSDGHVTRQVDRGVKERKDNETQQGKFFHRILSLRFYHRGRIVLVLRKILARSHFNTGFPSWVDWRGSIGAFDRSMEHIRTFRKTLQLTKNV